MTIRTKVSNKYIPVSNPIILNTSEFFWKLFNDRFTFCVPGIDYSDKQIYRKIRYRKQYKVKYSNNLRR